MSRIPRALRWTALVVLALGLIGLAAGGILYASVSSKLPDVQTLRDTSLQEPLYVYSRDGKLIAMFGEGRRYPIDIKQVPKQVKDAFIAAEDADFYNHSGVDFKGIARAVWLTLTTDDRRVPGGSTISMQVAKLFYQEGQKRDYSAKLAQILLARKIENELSKDEILELYLNKSFFGHRAYGIAAAAEFYYGKTLESLTLGELATLVGTPKFPSSANPLSNPERNLERRNAYILPRMVSLGMISQAQADQAANESMHASPHERPVEVYAPYVAEMVRQEMIKRYGDEALTKGYHVTTTIDPELQAAADAAVRNGLRIYDHRHGWRTVEKHFDLTAGETDQAVAKRLSGTPTQAGLIPVVVLETNSDGSAVTINGKGERITLPASAGRPWPGRTPASAYKRGDVARIRAGEKEGEWKLDQLPRAQATLVSLNPDNGALVALIGGYSFAGNKFNRATQAKRQPGSSFKPFVYAAAMERGFNPASIVLDAPVVFRQGNGKVWRPQNDGGRFAGPIRLREALVQSRNLVSVRLLDAIGVDYARRYISHFGFDEKEMPPNLSMSLGTASLTPLSVARGYAVFANGGSRVNAWFIDEVRDGGGKVIFKEAPPTACRGCGGMAPTAAASTTAPAKPEIVDGFNLGGASAPKSAASEKPTSSKSAAPKALPQGSVLAPRAIDERVAYQTMSMMGDVVKRGTGTAAKVLGRADIGGKTGSTNDHRDAWFAGYGGPYVTVVWVGRDDFKSLGYREYGGKAALPIWISYMRAALKDKPVQTLDPPDGMVKVGVSAGGQLIPGGGGITEWVKAEDLERMETYIDYGRQEQQQVEQVEQSYDIF